MNRLNCRMVADRLLDKRIADMELLLRTKGVLSLSTGSQTSAVVVNHRPVQFQFDTALRNVGSLDGLYQLDLSVSWEEGRKQTQIRRSLYIAG